MVNCQLSRVNIFGPFAVMATVCSTPTPNVDLRQKARDN